MTPPVWGLFFLIAKALICIIPMRIKKRDIAWIIIFNGHETRIGDYIITVMLHRCVLAESCIKSHENLWSCHVLTLCNYFVTTARPHTRPYTFKGARRHMANPLAWRGGGRTWGEPLKVCSLAPFLRYLMFPRTSTSTRPSLAAWRDL